MRYIVFKDKIYIPNIQIEGTEYYAPLENIHLVLGATESVDAASYGLLTYEAATELITKNVAALHNTVGQVLVQDIAEMNHIIADFNSGKDILLTDGSMFNQAMASPADIITFIPTPNSGFYSEIYAVNGALQLVAYTDNNHVLRKINLNNTNIDANNASILKNSKEIKHIEDALDSKIDDIDANMIDAKDLIGNNIQNISKLSNIINIIDKDALKVEIGRLDSSSDIYSINEVDSLQALQDQKIFDNDTLSKQNKDDLNIIEPKVLANETMVADYVNNKSDFVRIQDIQHKAINYVSTGTKPHKSGKDYTWTLAAADVAKFKLGNMTTIKTQDTTTSVMEYFKESYNDGHGTTINTGTNREFVVTLTDTTFTVHSNEDLSNHVIKYLVQEDGASTGTTIDGVARATANKNKADIALLDPKVTANQTQAATNKTDITTKQNKTDASLSTSTPLIVGAINEVKSTADAGKLLSESLKGKDVMNSTGNIVDLETMAESGAGTDADKMLVTAKTVDTKLALKSDKTYVNTKLALKSDKTYVDNRIMYYEDQVLTFRKVKTGSKFEDSGLFSKYLIVAGETLTGGTTGAHTNGSVIKHSTNIIVPSSIHGDYVNGNGAVGWDINLLANNSKLNMATAPHGGAAYNLVMKTKTQTSTTGGTTNLPAGVQILKVAYVAKKDITHSDMGDI